MKQVVITIPRGPVTISVVAGTVEILTCANLYWQKLGNKSVMEIHVAGLMKNLKLDGGIFSIHPVSIERIRHADLIIVPSAGYDDQLIKQNKELLTWIKDKYKKGAELATFCSGAFLIAATGLLDGRSCSTHWIHANTFRRLHPNIELLPERLITHENGIYTNGGAYSFLNLLLFLVEKYFDRETAIYCSKIFQIDIDRSLQSPFFIFQAQKNHGDNVVLVAQNYIEANVTEKISFEKLAVDLCVSRRNFDRRFIKATGRTPLEYLQAAKVELAKKAFEKGRKNVFEVMDEVGYSDEKAFREVFRKVTGLSPLEYKARFSQEVIPHH
jgi:transcriptional regulator GlxA family with amidase domain